VSRPATSFLRRKVALLLGASCAALVGATLASQVVAQPPPALQPPAAPPPKAQVEGKTVETPVRRTRYDVAVLQALDKVTADSVRFEAAVGRPVRYKSLVFTVKACERSAPDEAIDDSIVYLTVDSQPRPEPGKPAPPARQAFKGWMFASSPGLHPLEHPVYDAWLITCRATAPLNAAPVAGAATTPVAAPARPAPKAPVIPAAPKPARDIAVAPPAAEIPPN
jgi:hypothetical protein